MLVIALLFYTNDSGYYEVELLVLSTYACMCINVYYCLLALLKVFSTLYSELHVLWCMPCASAHRNTQEDNDQMN
jgi:hypothetical protein